MKLSSSDMYFPHTYFAWLGGDLSQRDLKLAIRAIRDAHPYKDIIITTISDDDDSSNDYEEVNELLPIMIPDTRHIRILNRNSENILNLFIIPRKVSGVADDALISEVVNTIDHGMYEVMRCCGSMVVDKNLIPTIGAFVKKARRMVQNFVVRDNAYCCSILFNRTLKFLPTEWALPSEAEDCFIPINETFKLVVPTEGDTLCEDSDIYKDFLLKLGVAGKRNTNG